MLAERVDMNNRLIVIRSGEDRCFSGVDLSRNVCFKDGKPQNRQQSKAKVGKSTRDTMGNPFSWLFVR